MSISDAQYTAFLRSTSPKRVLIEATSSNGSHYLADGYYVSKATDSPANQPYDDVLIGIPEWVEEIADPVNDGGISAVGFADVLIANENGVRDAWLDYAWDGREITVKVGAPDWALSDFRTEATGWVQGIEVENHHTLRLIVADRRKALSKPVQTNTVASGPEAGQPIPICLGECFNVSPRLLDQATHKYQVHDGPVQAIDDVRVGGLTVSYTADTATGTFTLGVAPDGEVTADVRGEATGGTYLTRADQLINWIVSRMGEAADSASMSALATAVPDTLGLYIREDTTAEAAIEQVAQSAGLWWAFAADNEIEARRFEIGSSVLTLDPDDIEQFGLQAEESQLPISRIAIGYQRNYKPQSGGLFGAVTEDNRALYGEPYSVEVDSDGTIDTSHPGARKPETFDTIIVGQADAAAEATRRLTLYGQTRTRWTAKAFTRPFELRVGDTITLDYPRFGFAGGADALVVASRRRLTSARTELTLWR